MKTKSILISLIINANAFSFNVPQDKRMHFAAGFAIGATATLSFKWGGAKPKTAMSFGIGTGTLAGVGKEVHDKMQNDAARRMGLPPPHSVEVADAAYTIAGAALGSWVAYKIVK
jgi:hypothetical protein